MAFKSLEKSLLSTAFISALAACQAADKPLSPQPYCEGTCPTTPVDTTTKPKAPVNVIYSCPITINGDTVYKGIAFNVTFNASSPSVPAGVTGATVVSRPQDHCGRISGGTGPDIGIDARLAVVGFTGPGGPAYFAQTKELEFQGTAYPRATPTQDSNGSWITGQPNTAKYVQIWLANSTTGNSMARSLLDNEVLVMTANAFGNEVSTKKDPANRYGPFYVEVTNPLVLSCTNELQSKCTPVEGTGGPKAVANYAKIKEMFANGTLSSVASAYGK